MSFFVFVMLSSAAYAQTNPIERALFAVGGIGPLYARYFYAIDSVMYAIILIGAAQYALHKQFEGRAGKAMIIGLGSSLAIAASFFEYKQGASGFRLIGGFAPVAAILTLVLFCIFFYRLFTAIGAKGKIAAKLMYSIGFFYINAQFPAIGRWAMSKGGWLAFTWSIMEALAIVLFIWGMIEVISWFVSSGKSDTTTQRVQQPPPAQPEPPERQQTHAPPLQHQPLEPATHTARQQHPPAQPEPPAGSQPPRGPADTPPRAPPRRSLRTQTQSRTSPWGPAGPTRPSGQPFIPPYSPPPPFPPSSPNIPIRNEEPAIMEQLRQEAELRGESERREREDEVTEINLSEYADPLLRGQTVQIQVFDGRLDISFIADEGFIKINSLEADLDVVSGNYASKQQRIIVGPYEDTIIKIGQLKYKFIFNYKKILDFLKQAENAIKQKENLIDHLREINKARAKIIRELQKTHFEILPEVSDSTSWVWLHDEEKKNLDRFATSFNNLQNLDNELAKKLNDNHELLVALSKLHQLNSNLYDRWTGQFKTSQSTLITSSAVINGINNALPDATARKRLDSTRPMKSVSGQLLYLRDLLIKDVEGLEEFLDNEKKADKDYITELKEELKAAEEKFSRMQREKRQQASSASAQENAVHDTGSGYSPGQGGEKEKEEENQAEKKKQAEAEEKKRREEAEEEKKRQAEAEQAEKNAVELIVQAWRNFWKLDVWKLDNSNYSK
ncbi:hypothetical protein COV19_01690 [Candidatus Woesearchaeota archaeon CG10_big_fil_rev_8_21_14_0_10_44_13]|nr:MAG: hypothetical protein COV19_01690 [Candidatus Woesearchaeota archaeon CG10_big_fil_rev_8_21_14_0_10_44_13]